MWKNINSIWKTVIIVLASFVVITAVGTITTNAFFTPDTTKKIESNTDYKNSENRHNNYSNETHRGQEKHQRWNSEYEDQTHCAGFNQENYHNRDSANYRNHHSEQGYGRCHE